MSRIAHALAAAACSLVLTAAAGVPAAAAKDCSSFSFERDSIPWRATAIAVQGVSCGDARRLIRRYAKPRDCQFQPRCRVGRWTCRTRNADGSDFDERCTRGGRVVRWHARYRSS